MQTRKRSRWLGVAVGGAVGAAMGFAIPYYFYVDLGGESLKEMGLALLGAAAVLGAIGALLGALGITTGGDRNSSQSETMDKGKSA